MSLPSINLRVAVRRLTAAPGYSAAVVLTLGLGLAAVSFLSAIAYGVLVRPLPYPRPAEVIAVGTIDAVGRSSGVSLPDVTDWREQTTAFQAIAPFIEQEGAVQTPAGTEPVRLAAVDHEFFDVLGIPAARGRMITVADEQPATVVLAWRTWQRLFAASPSVIGASIRVNGEDATIIGVAPADLTFPSVDVAAWIPLEHARRSAPPQWNMRGFRGFGALGRLRANARVAVAATDINEAAARLASEYPRFNRGIRVSVEPLSQHVAAPVRPVVLLMWLSALTLLLITCGNAAALTLARAVRRRHEWATRRALGCRAAHIVSEMLTEIALLTGAGTAAGLLAGSGLVGWFARHHPDQFPRPDAVRMDAPVVLATAMMGLGAAAITALIPAWRALGSDPGEAMKQMRAPGAQTRRQFRWLASAQMALSVALVMATVLMARQLWTALAGDVGVSRPSILTARIDLTPAAYAKPDAQRRFITRLLEGMPAAPGGSAGVVSSLPPAIGQMRTTLQPVGDPAAADVLVDIVSSTPGVFDVLGLGVLSGRGFSDADSADAPRVAILSRTAARLLFPGRDALGLRVPFGASDTQPIVVGIVGDVRFRGVDSPAAAAMYVPAAQRSFRTVYVVIDPAAGYEATSRELQDAVKRTDPDVALGEMRTLGALRQAAASSDAFRATSIAAITVSALFLACVGVYGVASESAAGRRKEFAVRVALGSTRGQIRRLILTESMRLCGAGVVAGVLLGTVACGFAAAYLEGLPPTDLSTAAIATVVAFLVGAAAAVLPAMRAAASEPSCSLRV